MIDFESLKSPLNEDASCGSDLEEEENFDFSQFIGQANENFPSSFFTFKYPQDEREQLAADNLNPQDSLSTINDFLSQTYDIRLLSLAARFYLFDRQIEPFCNCLISIADLLEQFWDDVHPRDLGDGFDFRTIAIEELDELPSCILPLQYAPLMRSRRHGEISYRQIMVQAGEAEPREGETVLDEASIRQELSQTDNLDQLVALYQALKDAIAAIKQIRSIFQEKAGSESVPTLTNLPDLLSKITALVKSALEMRDAGLVSGDAEETEEPDETEPAAQSESAAGTGPAATASTKLPSLSNNDEAKAALLAAEAYFAHHEPSSPCVLLIRQAQQLVGKSFIEAMEVLLPGKTEQAKIKLGADHSLVISMNQLKDFASATPPPPPEPEPEPEQSAAGEAADDTDPANGDNGKDKADANAETAAKQAPAAAASNVAAAPRVFSAPHRSDAITLLDAVELYYKRMEPSSPIPMLLSRAKQYVTKDFSTLVKELIGEEVKLKGE